MHNEERRAGDKLCNPGREDRQYDRHGMKIDVPEEQEEGRTCTEEEDCAPRLCRGR